LAEASTLCGACWEVCPVRIPLHDLLLELRQRDAAVDGGWVRRVGFGAWSWAWSTRPGFAITTAAGRIGRQLARRPTVGRRLPGWAGAWGRDRDVP
jgi:L-lactate dehydrogenase complex protein LldF